MRLVVALFAGGLFGAGLLLSGMTDTVKVQGFLDIFGAWDPTLAFVMAGAILPMTLAWAVARRRPVALLGTPIQTRADGRPDRALVIGSLLFGIGWGLAGLCPGPAIASLGFGGTGGLAFLLAMMAGMVAARPLRTRLSGTATLDTERQSQMEIRQLTPGYAVSPQITPDDIPAIKAAGFTRVICNRPDGEIPPALEAARMRSAVEAAGLEFVEIQVLTGDFSDGIVAAQRAAIDGASGPVFAYCASGRRCAVVWALGQAGRVPVDDLIATAARWGYDLEPFRARLG